jgi:peptidoglycan-associated lipoprotein
MTARVSACLAGLLLLAACSSDNGASTGGGGGGGAVDTTGGSAGATRTGGPAPGSEEDLVQSIGDRIYFDTDQSTPNPEARAILDRQAAWLQQYASVRVWVAGNCDERGTEEYNLALGQRRANADRDYLVAHGIDRGRIETISYGKARPVDPGSSAEAWAKNRNAITSVR